MKKEFPILEYDPNRTAMINPKDLVKKIEIPERCVVTFFKEVIDTLVNEGKAKEIACETSEMGRHPIYKVKHEGQEFTTYHSGVCAPLAAAMLEFVIQIGCKKFIACGSAGLLDKNLSKKLIVPTSAIRDEGLSYHYLKPGREVHADPEAVKAIINTLKKHDIDHVLGKTWTTDAMYRETRDKINLRKEESCVTVEMEAAAFFSVAKFRGVQFAQILYGSDDVSGEIWDKMNIGKKIPLREQIFWLAVEACLNS